MAVVATLHKSIKEIAKRLSKKYGLNSPAYQLNINLNLCNPEQKRVLFCYVPLFWQDLTKVKHSLMFHANQMLYYFLKKDYCIDLVSCHPDHTDLYNLIAEKEYDIVIGFGDIYKRYCESHIDCRKILFMTENNPVRVKELYADRVKYFSQRHPQLDPSLSSPRMEFYTEEMLKVSDAAILMQSSYNSESFKDYFGTNIWRVNSNALFNHEFNFDEAILREYIYANKVNFLWFGSRGLIHKGLDVVLDAFSEMPEFKLNCYGVSEKKLFNKLKSQNTIDCGRIDVMSGEFITKVVYQHNFVILNSCSEGMSTAVATCMCHGIIPIISKESGFDSMPFIIELNGYDIESVKKSIRRASEFTDDEILHMREACYQYARKQFSIEKFNNLFINAIEGCLSIDSMQNNKIKKYDKA